jgi:glc operon protein GlcG
MKRKLHLYLTLALLFTGSALAYADSHLVTQVPKLTLAGAKRVAKEAAKMAKANDWKVVIAICDESGNLVYLERMDDVQLGSLQVAIVKAESAALFRRESQTWAERINSGSYHLLNVPGAAPLNGGVPIIVDGVTIGAIGVSGVRGDQDAEIGKAGVQGFLEKL